MNMEGLVSHAIQTNGELRKLLLVDGRPYPLPELFEAIADDYQRLSGSEGRSECSPTWCLWPGQESRVSSPSYHFLSKRIYAPRRNESIREFIFA